MNKKGGWGEWGGGSMWVHSPVVKIEAITVNFMKKKFIWDSRTNFYNWVLPWSQGFQKSLIIGILRDMKKIILEGGVQQYIWPQLITKLKKLFFKNKVIGINVIYSRQ